MSDFSLPTEPITIDSLQDFGVTDPQIRIFGDKAYLYASHDINPKADRFVMPDWQLWSTEDLVNWNYETTLSPRQTYLKKDFDGCWAGDAICKNSKYYWCVSIVDQTVDKHEIALLSAPTPTGPWRDETGAPWIDQNAASTHVYDPGFLQLENGETFIVFGVWDYYIARLKEDMTGIAETPRKIEIKDPYGPYGAGKTDDKPFLHKRGDIYYLSWGAFYATSDSPYGPYQYRGCIIDPEQMEANFRERTWPHGPQQGRHGSFFEWRGQSYFIYCDMSFSGNRYYRGSWISYLHYRENGEIAPITVNSDAVGRYSAGKPIPAANYSEGKSIQKMELPNNFFAIRPNRADSFVSYPNLLRLNARSVRTKIELDPGELPCSITVANGDTIQKLNVSPNPCSVTLELEFDTFDPSQGIQLRFENARDGTTLLVRSVLVEENHQKTQ